jgi:hypothetical protein
MILLSVATNTQMTLTFDLDLDTLQNDASHMYLSLYNVSSTGIDSFFLYEFLKFWNDLDL